MTFKHTKFEDSITMRSLERLAKEKGLIKTDILEKIASTKPSKVDLTPTDNLTENLLKLCSGLRNAGMGKYAEELESTFMMYKQASTMCDSDLVEQAHPKGSYSLDGVEGDAVIETILDQQLAMIKMVEKKPTGKLTNAKSIINAVKISLGEDTDPVSETQIKITELTNKIKMQLNRVIAIVTHFINEANKDLTITINAGELITYINQVSSNPTKENLNDLIKRIDNLSYRASPGLIGGGVEKTRWDSGIGNLPGLAKQKISTALGFMEEIIKLRAAETAAMFQDDVPEPTNNSETPNKTSKPKNSIFKPQFDRLTRLTNQLNNWLSYQRVRDYTAAVEWITEEIKILNDISTRYNAMANSTEEDLSELTSEIDSEETDINTLKNNLFKPKPKS